jgi:hypothetical protein
VGRRALALGALVGCGLFPNLGDLTQSVDGAPPLDSSPAEAGAEAGPFCASIDADFCADFDDIADPLQTGFSSTNVHEMALARDLDAAVSSPASLLATFDDAGTNDTIYAYLQKDMFAKPSATNYTLEADLRVDAMNAQDSAIVMEMNWDNGAHRVYVAINGKGVTNTQENYYESDGGYSTNSQDTLDNFLIGATFQHVTLRVTTNPPHETVTFGAATELDRPLSGTDFNACTFYAGPSYVGGAHAPVVVHVDNVVFRQSP